MMRKPGNLNLGGRKIIKKKTDLDPFNQGETTNNYKILILILLNKLHTIYEKPIKKKQ